MSFNEKEAIKQVNDEMVSVISKNSEAIWWTINAFLPKECENRKGNNYLFKNDQTPKYLANKDYIHFVKGLCEICENGCEKRLN